ncbi:MAG: sugar ABC transporter permease [Clostridia bacterium]|nr:sugar ABC transporter permease [Clostridia bacterium]
MHQRQNLTGWIFLLPATLLIVWMSFYPMVRAFIVSLMRGKPTALEFSDPLWRNYQRITMDAVFIQSLKNTFTYLIIQVPVMLVLALIFASLLNMKDLKFKGLFRTCIFLPCATALVSYSIIFRTLFAYDGFINAILMNLHILSEPINWLNDPMGARAVIIIALIWRWTGYNMVFYLSSMQSIDYSVYESARIDGASSFTQLTKITIPLLKPVILVTAIMSTNGTLQLYDESVNLTNGGPANASITMSHYIYNTTFVTSPNFGYAAAMSFVILIMVAVLSAIQMKVGDKR